MPAGLTNALKVALNLASGFVFIVLPLFMLLIYFMVVAGTMGFTQPPFDGLDALQQTFLPLLLACPFVLCWVPLAGGIVLFKYLLK